MSAAEVLAAQIRREGSVTFDEFMETALYDPDHGFFAVGRGAGRAGRDFLTSPEVGALFGACVARAVDRQWHALDEPDPFLVVDAGAGSGRLAHEIRRAEPECLAALRYVLVERSAQLRSRQRELLPVEPADVALGPFATRGSSEELSPVHRAGPVFTTLAELPEMPIDAVVFANELLDNLPFGVAEWDGRRWNELRVTLEGAAFAELLVPIGEHDVAMLATTVAGRESALTPGARVPIPRGIEAWFAECSRVLHAGILILVDYVVALEELLTRGSGWLRSYREQRRASDVLDAPGTQDITGDVVSEQLVHIARASGFTITTDQSQADWLTDVGIEDLVTEARDAWRDGAARGDLDALAGRSRVHEAEALTDTAGLGAHRVVVLQRRKLVDG